MKKTYSKNSRQGLPGGPNEMFEKVKGIIVSQRGQWDFPGMNTMVPTDDGRITMRGVPYPVYGQDETGYGQMMYPGQEYQFPGNNVLELPMAQVGLQVPIQQPDALRVHMNINPNAEYMEKKKSDVLDLDNTLDYLVETRGGTRDLWGHMADTIGYHESGHTMDPLQMQNSGGPGRGIFQFEAPSLITAQNRYQRISDRLNLKPDPKILSAKSALELSPEQQYSLFLINLAESSAKLKDYADNKLPLVDLWLQGHKKIEKGENRGSFRTSVQKAKDKSIQKGYDSFKQLGGALPRFQYEGQFNPQLARPNPLTGKYAWEQSIPKKTAVNVAPKMQPAARATTNVQKQNLNLDRDNRLLDANLIYSDASSSPLSNAVHTGLDAVGMVPVIGEPADVANALLYNYEGDLENAALSTAGMIPFLGMLGTGKRLLGKAKKAFSQRGEDFGPERLIPEWGDRANPKLLVQSPPEIKSVFKGVPHYGKDPALEAASGALDVMKQQGRYLDNISFDASKLSPEQVKFHGIKHGRAVVEVALPNGNTQLFYKSSGLAGKSGAGVGNTTQDLWQPYGGHASNYASSNWFIKDEGFKDWYGSKSFRDISGNLDRIAAQGNYDLSGQLKAFKQLGGSLPKAQVGDEIFPGEGQYYNIPEYTYNYKRGFNDLPTPRYTGPLINQRLIDEATQREYEQRRRTIDESVAAAREPLSTQRLAKESAATGDKFSLQMNLGDPYNNPRLYDALGALDFINPGVMLGDMVTGLGSVPYNVQEGNYGAAAVGLGLPLATGALASIGVKSPRQFINNLVNPVAGIGDTPKQLPGSSNVAPVINAARNLEDLKAAQQFAQKYGYELPANLERVAQSNEFTDRVIRGMMNRHNNFVRGVSTNWEELGKRNPEILRHLEGKGFDLSTKEGTKAAAEYMATHIPINTGYGRASLDADVFNRGMQGLYTSNSIPTAEGYTYGQGYIVSGKKPTNYSSSNRQDWINQNNTYYKDEDQFRKLMYPLSEESKDIVGLAKVPAYEKNKMEVINSVKSKMDSVQKEIEQLKKGNVKYTGESIEESITIRNKIIEDLNKDIKYLEQHGDELLKKPGEYKILRTERSDLPTDPFAFLIQKEGNAKKMSEWLKTQPYQQKMREMNDLGESLSNYTWEQQKLIRDKIDILKKEANEMYNKSVQDYMKINHPDYDPVNKYAHYIHLGVPGEKVLQPIKSWEITPEIWKNKSRRHSNKYSKKFSAMANGGILNMQRFGGNLNFQKGGDYNMKRASELGYTPDEAGHYPSVDEETGMWLKSKQHPTAWMESMYGYQLNPEVYNNYNVTYNPEGYFGENQLQYVSKKFGGSLPTAGDPVLNFIQRQSPRFSKSKK